MQASRVFGLSLSETVAMEETRVSFTSPQVSTERPTDSWLPSHPPQNQAPLSWWSWVRWPFGDFLGFAQGRSINENDVLLFGSGIDEATRPLTPATYAWPRFFEGTDAAPFSRITAWRPGALR